jgi:hypothetical protein
VYNSKDKLVAKVLFNAEKKGFFASGFGLKAVKDRDAI